MSLTRRPIALFCFLLLATVSTAFAHMKAEKMSPEEGTVLNSPPRSLRVWFTQDPDLAVSKLELEGPEGAELKVEGVHSMGEKDLMGRVVGRMPNGEYKARWQAAGDDGHVQKGEWTFTVKRGSTD